MAKPMDQYTWEEIEVGAVVTEPGNAAEYKTGDWRSLTPVVDKEHCIICANECTTNCISMVQEEQ